MTISTGRNQANKAHWAEAFRAYMKSERYQKMNTVACAKALGVSKTTVSRWRIEAGLPPPQRMVNEERERRKLLLVASKEFGLKEKKSTLSIPDLMKLVGLPYHTVFYMQKKLGVEPFGQKYRSDAYRQPLVNSQKELDMIQLSHEWHRPKGMTEHLESLRD